MDNNNEHGVVLYVDRNKMIIYSILTLSVVDTEHVDYDNV